MRIRIRNTGVHNDLDTASVHNDLDTASVHTDLDTAGVHHDLDTAGVHNDLDTASVHNDLDNACVRTDLYAAGRWFAGEHGKKLEYETLHTLQGILSSSQVGVDLGQNLHNTTIVCHPAGWKLRCDFDSF